jgi:hypothetical protein
MVLGLMKEQEANQILFLMSAIWTQPISDATLLVWKQRIEREKDYELAQEAVSLLSDRCKFFPSIAEFHETIRSLKREPVLELDDPGTVLSLEETLSHINKARKELS